jgi:hypothetical protein
MTGTPGNYTPLRKTHPSLLSDDGVPLENIARLVGHQTTTVTETVYRKQLRPVIEDAATSMNRIFRPAGHSHSGSHQMINRDDPHSTFVLVGATGFEPVTPRL